MRRGESESESELLKESLERGEGGRTEERSCFLSSRLSLPARITTQLHLTSSLQIQSAETRAGKYAEKSLLTCATPLQPLNVINLTSDSLLKSRTQSLSTFSQTTKPRRDQRNFLFLPAESTSSLRRWDAHLSNFLALEPIMKSAKNWSSKRGTGK